MFPPTFHQSLTPLTHINNKNIIKNKTLKREKKGNKDTSAQVFTGAQGGGWTGPKTP